ncbi:MAG: hypothetical protein LC799_10135, partial [Actinobacteria bacterium]|nr:hypothetical protein [Actinomycetota bacterium]
CLHMLERLLPSQLLALHTELQAMFPRPSGAKPEDRFGPCSGRLFDARSPYPTSTWSWNCSQVTTSARTTAHPRMAGRTAGGRQRDSTLASTEGVVELDVGADNGGPCHGPAPRGRAATVPAASSGTGCNRLARRRHGGSRARDRPRLPLVRPE